MTGRRCLLAAERGGPCDWAAISPAWCNAHCSWDQAAADRFNQRAGEDPGMGAEQRKSLARRLTDAAHWEGGVGDPPHWAALAFEAAARLADLSACVSTQCNQAATVVVTVPRLGQIPEVDLRMCDRHADIMRAIGWRVTVAPIEEETP